MARLAQCVRELHDERIAHAFTRCELDACRRWRDRGPTQQRSEGLVINLRAGPEAHRYQVLLNGSPARRVVRVRALWNGAPGLVEYHLSTVTDGVLLTGDRRPGREIATAWRFGWRVEVVRIVRPSARIALPRIAGTQTGTARPWWVPPFCEPALGGDLRTRAWR